MQLHLLDALPFFEPEPLKDLMSCATGLDHPNLVKIYGLSVLHSQPYLLTEPMKLTLKDYFSQAHDKGGLALLTVSRDIARALHYLHQQKLHPRLKRNITMHGVAVEKVKEGHLKAKLMLTLDFNLFLKPDADVHFYGSLLKELSCLLHTELDLTKKSFEGLVELCLNQDPRKCPNMAYVLDQLEGMIQSCS